MGRGLNTKAGEVIGRVTIIGREGSVALSGNSVATWNVRCECGKEWVARSPTIREARKKCHWECQSCSASKRDYGIKGHYLSSTWYGMVSRCYNKNSLSYHRYGGRGIHIFHEWLEDRSRFAKWVDDNLGQRPDGYTLDRIDNDEGYIPGNLRWADAKTQGNNQSKSRNF